MTFKASLKQTRELEKKYYWVKAADHYEQALRVVGKTDFLRKGEIQERIGFCFHRAAMQAKSQEEFKEKMQQAIEAYVKAQGFYEKLKDEQKVARMFRCRAVAKYLGYWLTSDPPEKRKLLDDCLELENSALMAFEDSENMLEYGKTYNELSLVFYHRVTREWNRRVLRRIVEEGIQWGEKAVAALHELGDPYEIVRAHLALASCLKFLKDLFVAEPEKQEQQRLKVVERLSNALVFSEKVEDDYLIGLSHLWLGLNTGGEECIEHFEKTLECGEKTRDNFLKATGLNSLAHETYWKAVATEDPDKRRQLAENAMKFYDKAQHHNFIMSFLNPRGGALSPPRGYAEYYLHLAMSETDRWKKLKLLQKSEEAGMKALKVAVDSDIPIIIYSVFHLLSKTLESRARLEPDFDEKRRLLKKVLEYRRRTIEITEQLVPFSYWDRGVMHNYLAEAKAELGYLEPDLNRKTRLLAEATSYKKKCLKLFSKTTPYLEKMGNIDFFAALFGYQDSYETLLNHLYELTKDPEHLRKAIEISQKAIISASKLDMIGLIAESYWKTAKVQDILGEHLESAKNFENASESYMKAAEKIPQLKSLYQDYAIYMKAWSEIEKARHYHAEKQYGQAREHYEKTANLHDSTERWNYLHPNYLAWARLEAAEDLSRRGQTEQAKDLFQQATKLFVEAKKSIEAELETIEIIDEKELAAELIKASDKRKEYCLGRTTLEEAKNLERQGDPATSSKKYGSAAEKFQEIARNEPEHSLKELLPMIYLCRAWQKMMMAEAKASSTMYGEAAELFKRAKEYTLDQPTSLLALAHSSFCKALEAGAEFEITRDITAYSAAKKHTEAAANYYLKAGFKNASEYARATCRHLDAYMYMNQAETETEPRKKAQYYEMAEKLLQASASSYIKAKHPEKSEEVQRLLERVNEERKLAISLTEVLHAPAIASTTTSFSTPTPTYEKAVGLEKFEHADIQVHLSAPKEIRAGEEFEIWLDLINVAKQPGLLVRIEDLVSSPFKITQASVPYNAERKFLDIKGKRLAPHKVESIKISTRSAQPGNFQISPTVVYVDDLGKFKTFKCETFPITILPQARFQFKTDNAQKVFQYLTKAFVGDYMKGKLVLEKSGWRTLVQIQKNAKVPKSSIYGTVRRRGYAVSELERRGIIETRMFPGERGRGGTILKARISYEKETVKRWVDRRIMKNVEK